MDKDEICWKLFRSCGKMTESDYLGRLDLDERITIKYIFNLGWQGVDWNAVADGSGSASCFENGDEMCGFLDMQADCV